MVLRAYPRTGAQTGRLLPDFDPQDAYPAVDEVMKEDWSDATMAEYDD